MAELRVGSATHPGQLRTQNEDSVHTGDGLFVVADGMGGHLAGEVASEIAVRALESGMPADQPNRLDDLVTAVTTANGEIYTSALDDPERAGMGTTLTALAVVADDHDGEAFGVANVGDSRMYVVRHGRLRQVTVDHSFVQELVAEGAITRDEARTHPRRNIVTRALGIEPYVRVDSWTMPVIRGDRFVLCSDGLVDEVADDTIMDVLAAHTDDPEAAAQALVDAANAAGGRDNISVIVVDVLAGDDPPDPTQEFDVVPTWRDDDDDTAETPLIGGGIVADPLDDEPGDTDDAGTATGTLDDAPPRLPDAPPFDGAAELTAAAPGSARTRGGRLVRFLLTIGVAAVLIFGGVLATAWARSGYFVGFDDNGEVWVYQGQKGTVLWVFNPTKEERAAYTRADLDEQSILFVESEPEYANLQSARDAVRTRLQPADAPEPTVPSSTAPSTSTTVPRAAPATPPDSTLVTTVGP
ncbi:MAG TPA: Stp1/IreP family PP2C-type Ser/Thr phosphatase [Ilumatobacter sp.]|nr:Stp1/IreP family PP2C-type Ser/Thr phosphatase [Ilumatobacter sp.]